MPESVEHVALNTDHELYREDTGCPAGSYYENSLHVTAQGAIGMNVGGRVFTMPIAEWHALAVAAHGTDWGPHDYTAADLSPRHPNRHKGLILRFWDRVIRPGVTR